MLVLNLGLKPISNNNEGKIFLTNTTGQKTVDK